MSRQGTPGSTLRLIVRFRQNGLLFDPATVGDVKIYDSEVGGTLISTLTPQTSGTGIYYVDFLSSESLNGQYWDQWEWVAEAGGEIDVRRVSFTLSALSTVSTSLEYSLELRLQVIERSLYELTVALNNLVTKREFNHMSSLNARNVDALTTKDEELENRIEVLEA